MAGTFQQKKYQKSKGKSSSNPILLTKEIKNAGKKGAHWENPLQHSGFSLQLVELIKSKKKRSVGEPLEKLRLFPSVGGTSRPTI